MRRITEAQIAAEAERLRLELAGEWFPTRWWRVVLADGTVWCETSDEDEAREEVPKGATVQHLFEKHNREWRDA